MLRRDVDVEEHILNISSYQLTFFQKLVLYRGLKFAIPQRQISAMEIKVNFEKAYWWHYIERRGARPPKALVRSINQLKKRDDVVIRKQDKGSGVVVMNKSDYVRLLGEASINDETKFKSVSLEEIQEQDFNEDHILVSYEASALFTKVSLEETIQILANKAFTRNWFNQPHNLNITQDDLVELLPYEWLQNINCFNSTAVFMNKLMA